MRGGAAEAPPPQEESFTLAQFHQCFLYKVCLQFSATCLLCTPLLAGIVLLIRKSPSLAILATARGLFLHPPTPQIRMRNLLFLKQT